MCNFTDCLPVLKRDLLRSSIAGLAIELAIGLFLLLVVGANPEMMRKFMWLSRLQDPGLTLGEAAYRTMRPGVGYAWAVYAATAIAILIQAALWGSVVLASITMARRFRK